MFSLFKSTKIFNKNNSREEFIEWIVARKSWNQINREVISSIVDKFIDEPELLKHFVLMSEERNLINTVYSSISKDIEDISVVLCMFSVTHYNIGCTYRDQVFISNGIGDLPKLFSMACCFFEFSFRLNEGNISAYFQIGNLMAALNRNDEAIRWCNKALTTLNKMKKSDDNSLTIAQKSALEVLISSGVEEVIIDFISNLQTGNVQYAV